MKKIMILSLAAIVLTGCWTSIKTVAPTTEVVVPVKTVYTTTVTTPTPKQTTVSTLTVTNYNNDPSFYLDLNAVAAAYAESRSVREFEQILNSSRYMINNLDLNRDGWVDYLRVIESRRGYYYTMLIQACLAPGVFQDVATLVAERRPDALYVEVIGDTYLYGYNYIVRPVFVTRPPMWDAYGYSSYAVWTSPYYYGSYPGYYTQPQPIYLNHYQAYVTTYMSNNHYCHHCDYPTTVFYNGYTTMTQPNRRNDYATQHPDNSFERRVQRVYASGGESRQVRNAGQLRAQAASSNSSARGTSNTSNTSSTRGTNNTSNTSSTRTATTTTRQPSTTIETRVNKSGTTRTTVKQTDATGRTKKVERSATSATRSTRNASTTSTTRKDASTTSTRSSRSTTNESSPRSSQRAR